jgi:MarR family 2-MHQ and catechol resistance regulon transcriptional repressor
MGTHHRGTDDEVRALDAYIKLLRAAESVASRLSPQWTGAGLTVSQFGAIEALWHLGPMCQADLGKKLLKSGGNITMVVANLERRGLVRRARDNPADRRIVNVYLTDEGRALIADMWPGHVAAIHADLAVLTPDDQVELARLCRKLGRRL